MSSPDRVLAIIPARGGSKGIPGKNVRRLGGRPLVAHSIAAAKGTRSVTRVVVSTDDDAIAAAATQYGAEVCRRPADISGDKASSEQALLHVLESLERTEGYRPAVTVLLQCTSPLTTSADIDGVVALLADPAVDSALSASRFYHFVWRASADGAEGINHDKRVRPMRQDREPQFLENGAIYAFRTDGFIKSKHRFFGRTALYEMPPDRTLEIDEPHDFAQAEQAIRRLGGETKRHALKDVAALAMDFDGVFTDNAVYLSQEGVESVRCSRGDGLGLGQLKASGLPMIVLSKEANPVVTTRCRKLGITARQEIHDKLPALREWASSIGVSLERVAYVGNDVNDLECLGAVGCPIVVADAHPDVLGSARIVLDAPGGHGALRELTDLLLSRTTTPHPERQ